MAQTINVNTTPGQFMPTLYYSQGDIGREFEIVLASSDGWSIPAGATVEMVATKPSGFGFAVSGTLSDNTATFVTTETMTNEWGRFPAEVRISSSGDVIGTANFYLSGERDPHPEETIDGDAEEIIPELTLLVERVEAAASSVLDMTVVANTLPAGSDATYSYDEETNTATFGIPKGADGSLASGVLAPTYSSSSTYAVGDYVYYSGNLYRCTTAITTAEAWTSGHWTQVALAPEVTDVKSDLSDETSARILLAGRVTTAESDIDTLETHKVAQPLDEYNQPTDGTDGQSLRTKGDGTTEWADIGLPTDEQTAQAVSDWLDDHPEATTTVQDHSLTYEKLVIGTLGYVTPEMFGAKGDGVTDDSQAISLAFNSGSPVWLSPKIYASSGRIIVEDKSEVSVIGNNAVIKNIGSAELENANDCFLTFFQCDNISIFNLILDSGVEFVARPVYGDVGVTTSDIDAWIASMQSKIHGFGFKMCNKIDLNGCVSEYCRAGYFISGCTNGTFVGNATYKSLADGIFVTGASKKITVNSHKCELVQDDNLSAVGYDVDESKNPQGVVFSNCVSKDCFGAITCHEGSTYTETIGCVSINNRAEPIKLGNLVIGETVIAGHHQKVANCIVKTNLPQDTHYLSNPNYLDIVTGVNGNEPHDIIIESCTFDFTIAKDTRLFIQHANTVLIRNCEINIGIYCVRSANVRLHGNKINGKSNTAFQLVQGLDIRVNHIYNDCTYVGSTTRALYMLDCSDLVMLDNTIKTESTNSTNKANPCMYELSTTDVDGLIANNPFQINAGSRILTNVEYLGVFTVRTGATTPAYTVFKLGQLLANSLGLQYRNNSAWTQIVANS